MAGDMLGQTLAQETNPVFVIFGMLGNKDAKGFLEPMSPHIKAAYTIPIKGQDNGANPNELCTIAENLGVLAKACPSLQAALADIRLSPNPTILITGSLYLAGQVLADIGYHPK
jgi:dihydrofolate synthase/folylpolyglutamate synthase